jgi:biotin operon repressor
MVTFAAKSSPSLRMIVDELDISKDTVWHTIEDLEKMEDCSCFALYCTH